MNLAIRISRTYEDVFDWYDAIEAEKKIIYEHEADDEIKRTHVHMLLIDSKCKPDALKTRYKKLYGDIDKTDWSFKTALADYLPYITYMSKGTLVPKLSKGFEMEQITELMSKWIDPKTTMVKLENGKLVRTVKESPQKTKRELLEQMRSRMSSTDSTRDVLRHIRKVLIDNNQVIGQYKMFDFYDSLMMYERESDWLYAMEQKINSKYGV